MKLLKNSKFWIAVVALAQTILFQFVPSFPQGVWEAIDGVLVILIAALTTEDTVTAYAKLKFTGNTSADKK